MSMDTRPAVARAIDTMRAWFPEHVFKCDSVFSMQTFSVLLHVTHKPTALSITQAMEENLFDNQLGIKEIVDNIVENMAETMHHSLAMRGVGTRQFCWRGIENPWGSQIETMLRLMGYEVIDRECTIGEDDRHARWVVKRDFTACRIYRADLDKPLAWWQEYLSARVRQDQELTRQT